MLNPSKADGTEDDPTIRRVVDYAKQWGYGSVVVVNLFAFRATRPDVMFDAIKEGVDVIGHYNDACIRAAVAISERVVFAWGGNGHVLDRATAVAGIVGDAYCLEMSGHGFPKHPLYLKKTVKPRLIHLKTKDKFQFIVPLPEHNRPLPARLVMDEGKMHVTV